MEVREQRGTEPGSHEGVLFSGVGKRSEPRCLCYSPIEFTDAEKGDEPLKGTVVNVSNSGVGIHSFVPLREGQEITIVRGLTAKHETFAVRWANKLLEDFFMAGLTAIVVKPTR